MKVILVEDVKKIGKKGEVKEVKEGYAHNFLFPKNLAKPANKQNLNALDREEEAKKEAEAERKQAAQKIADTLKEQNFVFKVKSGEGGRLFGSITTKEIAKEIESQFKMKIDKRKLSIEEPIKQLGTYNVHGKFHPEVAVDFRVTITD